MTTEDLQQIQSLVTNSKVIWVLTHKNPSVDTMASALSLYLSLVKMGKDVTVAMESEPLVEVSGLVAIDRVRTRMAGKNLLVTYAPYQLGDIETVSYLEDESANSSFQLTLTPREGVKLDPKNFSYGSTGASADLIFTVEVVEPQDLGALYNADVFSKAQIINIDNHDENKDYGRFNLVEPNAATVSEITTFFIRAINAELDEDISNNLYKGLSLGSDNFQSPKVGAATFEAAAICLRSGAAAGPKPAASGSIPLNQPTKVQPQKAARMNDEAPQVQETPVQPTQPAQDDWNAPKVYRGTSTI